MNTGKVAELLKKYEQVEFKANAKSMDEIVAYIEENWLVERVKIKEAYYNIHYKNALEYMKSLGKSTEGVEEEIRRYQLPNGICVILGMQSEYITVEDGLKYYQALTLLKGLTQEDIDTKNDRWLNYVLMLAFQEEWDAQESALKAEREQTGEQV